MLERLKNNNHRIGIEINAAFIKLLEFEHKKANETIINHVIMPTPKNSIVNNRIKNISAITNAIQPCLKTLSSSAKYVNTVVPNTVVLTNRIQIDAGLKQLEIEAQIADKVTQLYPDIAKNLRFDYKIVGYHDNNKTKIDVILFLCQKHYIDSLTVAINTTGLVTKTIDVDYYVLACAYNCFINNKEVNPDKKYVALINLTISTINLLVLQNNSLIYQNYLDFDGLFLINLIPWHAIRIHCYNVPIKQKKELFNKLILSTQKCLQYFYSSPLWANKQESGIEKLLLSGEFATIEGISQAMQDKIGIPTSIAQPFSHFTFANEYEVKELLSASPALLTCCGLATQRKHYE